MENPMKKWMVWGTPFFGNTHMYTFVYTQYTRPWQLSSNLPHSSLLTSYHCQKASNPSQVAGQWDVVVIIVVIMIIIITIIIISCKPCSSVIIMLLKTGRCLHHHHVFERTKLKSMSCFVVGLFHNSQVRQEVQESKYSNAGWFPKVVRLRIPGVVHCLLQMSFTPPKINMSPEKGPFQKDKYIFQPSCFMFHVRKNPTIMFHVPC